MQYEYKTKEEVKKYLESHLSYSRRQKKDIIKKKIQKILSYISAFHTDKKLESVVIYGGNLGYLCDILSKQYCVITIDKIAGINTMEYYKNKHWSVLNYRNYVIDAANAYINDDKRKMEAIKKEFMHFFKYTKPKLILTIFISRTADRIMYDAARECKIPVVLMEHGFITNAIISDMYMKENTFAKSFIDYYWFWSDKDREIYIEKNLCKEENSFVLGYPHEKMESYLPKKLSVLFVGEAMEDNVDASIKFHKMANDIYKLCDKMGIPFKYKKHPKENTNHMKEYLSSDICFVGDLFKEFRDNQIVVGGRTSALMEAGIMGNYVVQIDYDHERVKNFIFEHCYFLEDYQNEFEPLLVKIKNKEIYPKKISSYEFYQPENLLLQFCKGVEKVERHYDTH